MFQKLLNGGDCGEVKKAAAKEEWAEIRFEATERPRVEMEGFTGSWEGEKKDEDEKDEVRSHTTIFYLLRQHWECIFDFGTNKIIRVNPDFFKTQKCAK